MFEKTRRIIFLFIVLAVFISSAAVAQDGTIKGQIVEEETKDAIIGANIFWLTDRTVGTATDIEGNFELSLPTGKQKVIFSYTGMVTDTVNVNVKAGESNTITVTMRSASKELGVVVVSAGKFEQKLEELTMSMEVLKPSLIENKNTTSIETALEQTPGLTILDSEPQIRGGSGFNFGVGSRVAVMVDDLPVLVGDVGKAEWHFLPVENIEQVEVVKGASSVLYGSSALSGAINIRTAYPKSKPQTKVNIHSGVYSTPARPEMKWWGNETPVFSGVNFFHSRKFERIDFVFGGNFLYDHGFIGPPAVDELLQADTITNEDVAEKKGRMNFSLRYRPKKIEGLSFGVNGNFMKSHSNFSLVWEDADTAIYEAMGGTMTLTDQFMFYVDPFITYYAKNGVRHNLKSRIFYVNNDNGNGQSNKSTVYFGDYQFQREFASLDDLTVTAGLTGNYTHSYAELYAGGGQPLNRARNFAAYMQVDKKIRQVLTASAGMRYEYYQINDQEFVVKPVFRTGFNLQAGKQTFFRASYGQGYRFPTIAEKFIRTSAGGMGVYPNTELQPETSWNAELGIKQGVKIWRFVGYLDIAGFWQEYKNAMEYVFAKWEKKGANYGFKFVNSGDIQVRGVDISLLGQGKFNEDFGMNLLAGYTFTKPVSLTPHEVYARDSSEVYNPTTGQFESGTISYVNSSIDTTNYILKYRFQHLAKADIEFTYKKFAVGYSVRYYSYMQNIDRTFYKIDIPAAFPGVQSLYTGITHYRGDEYVPAPDPVTPDQVIIGPNKKGNTVMDMRLSYEISKRTKLAFVVSNIMNKEYSLRPLKIEAPRTSAIQFTFKV